MGAGYVGRFAPSPTGPLHAGSLVAAFASWLDARAHGGRWLVRIEDVDRPRCVPGADEVILQQLAACGLVPDAPVVWQSHRDPLYQAALGRLVDAGWAYPCACSRKDVLEALAAAGVQRPRHGELVYPGTCRYGLRGRDPRAMRALAARRVCAGWQGIVIDWQDRRLGRQTQDLTREVGDFVLRRADGLWAYQLAVVVDDADQGVTDVVRGEDLADNTPRQIHLQRLLGLPTPRYLHTPLVRDAHGEKLSKQTGAEPFDATQPVGALRAAGSVLGLSLPAAPLADLLAQAVRAWGARWVG
ncbi:MAG TPA: tRNA glutamyl-Q(34) synthetase GluQRS [Burkholderiaceae bacterium]|nr:tRNA glutamyl-Q(34) synthetase GluQRS [Burkholderiaceae bacterium]